MSALVLLKLVLGIPANHQSLREPPHRIDLPKRSKTNIIIIKIHAKKSDSSHIDNLFIAKCFRLFQGSPSPCHLETTASILLLSVHRLSELISLGVFATYPFYEYICPACNTRSQKRS